MADDIPKGQPQLSVPQEVHRFIAECRERGKSTEYPDHEKGSGFR